MAGTNLYDFTGIKAISTPWGTLSKITSSAGAVIWQKQVLYSYSKLDGYVWKKYRLDATYELKEGSEASSNMGTIYNAYKNVGVDSNGKIYGIDGGNGDYTFPNGLPDFDEYPYINASLVWIDNYEWLRYNGESGYTYSWIPLYVEGDKSRGSYIGEVTDTSHSAYPDNGDSGSYWYVYDRASYTTVKSEYKLNEGAQTTLSSLTSQYPDGYPSVWVDTSGTIHGNGDAYSYRWSSYYSTYKSSYPYIYYGSKWYKIVSATRTSATVIPLTTSK